MYKIKCEKKKNGKSTQVWEVYLYILKLISTYYVFF